MKQHKDIQNHIDQLMNKAATPSDLKTSSSFMKKLNHQIDHLDNSPELSREQYHITDYLKYAAVILITLLNAGAIYTLAAPVETQPETTDALSEVAAEYFPDYTTIAELE